MTIYNKLKSTIRSIVLKENEFLKSIGSTLGKAALGAIADTAGTLANSALRTTPLAAFGDVAQSITSRSIKDLDSIFTPAEVKTTKQMIRANKYFYQDDYFSSQSTALGYDADIPRDKFNSTDISNIKNRVYPIVHDLGYRIKFLGKRDSEDAYLFILFKGNSKIPLRDGRRNPIVYPMPFDVFQAISNETSPQDRKQLLSDFLKKLEVPDVL